MNSAIWAIPGFLGLPTDWDFLQGKQIVGVDLHAFSWNSMSEWAKQFNDWAKRQKKKSNVLMGYSLGGRLALHALIDQPEQWQAAILISTHVGLTDSEEQQKRQQHDREWAQRFETEEWNSLMQAWNAQEVFARDSFHFSRQEQHDQRKQLANILIQGSLGKQANLQQQISTLPLPILWITGSDDHRFCKLAQTLTFNHPHSQWVTIAQAGHRAPWSQPQKFLEIIEKFLSKINLTN